MINIRYVLSGYTYVYNLAKAKQSLFHDLLFLLAAKYYYWHASCLPLADTTSSQIECK